MNGLKVVTIKDIAKICNVGVGTVSRAINNDPGINEQTKARVLAVVEQYHYVPNNSARNLKMTESNTVALLVRGIDNPFFSEMFGMFQEELEKCGYDFILHPVSEHSDPVTEAETLVKEKRLKGIVFLGGRVVDVHERLGTMGVPYVLCTVSPNMEDVDTVSAAVSIDDARESYKMVDYLCRMGHRRIAIITGKENDSAVGANRLKGYYKALHDHGIPVDEALVRPMKVSIHEFTAENGYAVTKELMDSGVDFSAIYCISDLTAIGAYKAIFDAGKRIPGDISVAGFDGIAMSGFLEPGLTTVCQPRKEMIQSSVEILMDAIEKGDKPGHRLYEATLLERQSVKNIG